MPMREQVAGVQYILDSVVAALAANPDRKFIYSEMVGGLGRAGQLRCRDCYWACNGAARALAGPPTAAPHAPIPGIL